MRPAVPTSKSARRHAAGAGAIVRATLAMVGMAVKRAIVVPPPRRPGPGRP